LTEKLIYLYLSKYLCFLKSLTSHAFYFLNLAFNTIMNFYFTCNPTIKWINWVDFKISKLFLAFIVELEIGLISPQLNFLCSSCYSFNALSSPPSKFADGNLPNTHDHAQSSSLCAIVSLCIWYISIMSIPGNFNRQIILE
jgi:hypothetical protein